MAAEKLVFQPITPTGLSKIQVDLTAKHIDPGV